MTDKPKIRLAFNTHGLGDCVHAATALRLYIQRGYDVQIQVEDNKRWVWEAAGIPIYEGEESLPVHPYYYPDMGKFWDLSAPDHTFSKISHFFEIAELPKLGAKEEVWQMICAERFDASPFIPPEAHAEAEAFLKDMPRPIFVLHTKGTNWQAEKSIPDDVALQTIVGLLSHTSGSVIVLDYDCRAPMVGDARCKGIKPSWGHIGVDRLCALLQRTDLFIGVDSGPFHVASLMTQAPCLGVFRKIPAPRCCLPSSTTHYLAPAKDHEHWASRSGEWKFLEYPMPEVTATDIVSIAMRLAFPEELVMPAHPNHMPDIPGRYTYRRVGHDERAMELLPDGKIGEGAAGCELVWKIERTPVGPVLTIYGHHGGATCHLTRMADGVFRGRWLAHEKMPIELIRGEADRLEAVTVTSVDLVPIDAPAERFRFAVGIPTLNRYDLLEKCIAACWASSVKPERIVIIDNGGGLPPGVDVLKPARNIGVAASWNIIHRVTQSLDLIILNDDIEPGHNMFERMLESPESFVTADESHMFEAFLIRRECWKTVGEFDETFYPAYHEDNDYAMRMRLANVAIGCPQSDGFVENGPSATKARFTQDQINEFHAQFDAGRKYYVRKWGGAPHVETFSIPFNGQSSRT